MCTSAGICSDTNPIETGGPLVSSGGVELSFTAGGTLGPWATSGGGWVTASRGEGCSERSRR